MLRPIRLTLESDPCLIETMRQIFVSAIPDFTKSLVPPTPVEQQAWWANLDHSKVKVFLWRLDERPWEVVAFSMVTDRGEYATPIFAIDSYYRGRGFARQIIRHYITTANKPLRGEQLSTNAAICRLNAEAGWRVVGTVGTIQLLEHDGPNSPTYPRYDLLLRGLDG